MINEIALLKKLETNLNWFALEFDFTEEENPRTHIDEIIKVISTESNYEPYGVFEDIKRKGLCHLHCRKK